MLINNFQLNTAGVFIANNCSEIDYTQLEEIYSRLDFYDSILQAKASILNIYPDLRHTHPIHMCAWMNSRILGNCKESPTNNGTTVVRDTLNNMCGGRGRRRCDPQLCIL